MCNSFSRIKTAVATKTRKQDFDREVDSSPQESVWTLVSIGLLGLMAMGVNVVQAAQIEQVAIKYQGGDLSEWAAAGVTIVLDRAGDLALRQKCRRLGLRYYRIYNVFYPSNPDIDVDTDALISDQGESSQNLHSPMLCPAHESVRQAKLEAIAKDLTKFDPDGISLDFVRFRLEYDNHRSSRWRLDWEEVLPDAVAERFMQFSFDRESLQRFQHDMGVVINTPLDNSRAVAKEILSGHREAWQKWKCGLVTSMVAEIRRIAFALNSKITVMIHLVPWRVDEFDDALGLVAGQDPISLARHVDVFAPMTYHPFLGREADWVGRYTRYLRDLTGKDVWPCIQAMPIDLQEHEDLPKYSVDEMKSAWGSVVASGANGITLYGPAEGDLAAMQLLKGFSLEQK